MFRVSYSTINCCIDELGIRDINRLSSVTDDALDALTNKIRHDYPQIGISLIRGSLRAGGLHIQTRRIRLSLQRIDPLTAKLRWGATVQRTYSVASANTLWHHDANLSLGRLKISVHGCIDGFSRTVIYLRVRDNNQADTVVKLFIAGTAKYGIPSRVRGDKGSENVDVAAFMIQARGSNRSSYIARKSVHNQRIERLWRYVFRVVLAIYYHLF